MLSLFIVLGVLGVIWTGTSLRRGFRQTDRRVLDLVLNSSNGRPSSNDVALAA